jgi:co-chaperonin GroES (HSP10)
MIKIIGDRVLVALPPREDEVTTASGLVLIKDPDRFYTPTRGIVVALGEKTGTVDLDEVCALVREFQGSEDFIGAEKVFAAIRALAPVPFDVDIGDCVIFPPSAGDEIRDGEIDYVILREVDIIGVVAPQKDTAA